MPFAFLLIIHAIIAALLVTIILMQKSEGGGFTSGGSPGGLMSARGAADFLTRATGVLAVLFVAMSILLATLAATRGDSTIDTSLAKGAASAPVSDNGPQQPANANPLAGAADAAAGNGAAPANRSAPADDDSVPLAQ